MPLERRERQGGVTQHIGGGHPKADTDITVPAAAKLLNVTKTLVERGPEQAMGHQGAGERPRRT